MDFSTMVLSMYVDADEDPAEDERVLQAAIEQSLLAGELGFNPWYTEHHFRGPWHSAPIQFAAYIAPQLPKDRYLGFGVLSVPYHHPVRLVEQMNLLDQLTKGHALFGLGSGFPGIEPASAGLDVDYHRSGQATRDSLEVMERLWSFAPGDPPYEFETKLHRGRVVKRIAPSAHGRRRPTIIRTARNDEATREAATRGWPAFLGSFGANLETQLPLYRSVLEGAGHPQAVVGECLRWSTVDWLSVIVTERAEDAERLVELARRERMLLRERFLAHAPEPVHGPAIAKPGAAPTPAQFAAGGDMTDVIAGTPEQVADDVRRLQELGVNHLLLRFLGEWHGATRWIAEQSMRLFSEQVMPEFDARDTDDNRELAGRTR
jgi:alkanesulfonate monooxygenase SsuD/methylene tetrahydromethanopterin reductase-like flavin-dependent oxidoreductase (luciferase family)